MVADQRRKKDSKFCLSCCPAVFAAPHRRTGIQYVFGGFSVEQISAYSHLVSASRSCPMRGFHMSCAYMEHMSKTKLKFQQGILMFL